MEKSNYRDIPGVGRVEFLTFPISSSLDWSAVWRSGEDHSPPPSDPGGGSLVLQCTANALIRDLGRNGNMGKMYLHQGVASDLKSPSLDVGCFSDEVYIKMNSVYKKSDRNLHIRVAAPCQQLYT